MKKLVLTGLLSAGLVLASFSAQAKGGYHYRHGGYHGGDDLLIAAGIIGGAVLIGSILAPRPYYQPAPVYYQPAPVYYQPAPVVYVPTYRPTCYQDRVYRYLPDGRIQWGTRTRCY